ncbi:hypothetical protein AEST_12530 [Alishewanella aestuarii B11]|uniref:Uncharacterized protein n=1 Tax=Alishewanella aestuarii B11 TaxID=1197174 RepID=J1QJX5_9ALTE|nr:hypothetical protein AEST_12530 [Alishewanella aestuarii B11]
MERVRYCGISKGPNQSFIRYLCFIFAALQAFAKNLSNFSQRLIYNSWRIG